MSQPICILVFGMHRCGTSATTGLLDIMGIELGDKLMPPTSYNPKGYYEHLEIRDVNDRMLSALNSSWDSFSELPSTWPNNQTIQGLKHELSAILIQQFSASQLFAIKDPRISKLLPVWEEVMRDLGIQLRCLIAMRNPLEVAVSLAERDSFSTEKSMLLWLDHILQAEKNSRNFPRVIVNFRDILTHPVSELHRIEEVLDISYPVSLGKKKQVIETFIDDSLNHAGQYTWGTGDSFPSIGEVYNLMEKLRAEKPEGPSRYLDGLDTCAAKFNRYRCLFMTPEIKDLLAKGKQKMKEEERPLLSIYISLLKERLSQFTFAKKVSFFMPKKPHK